MIPGFINSKYTNPFGGPDASMKSPGKTVTNDMYASRSGANTDNSPQYESSPLQNSPPQAQPTQVRAENPYADSPYQNQNQNQNQSYQPEYKNAQSLSSSPARERLYEARQNDILDRSQPAQPQQAQQPPRDEYRQPVSPNYTSSPQFAPSNTYGGFSSPKQGNMYAPDNHRSMTDMNTYFKKPHNPITNPLPVNVQNPYIAKEMNKVIQRQPYFANMATNNLIG